MQQHQNWRTTKFFSLAISVISVVALLIGLNNDFEVLWHLYAAVVVAFGALLITFKFPKMPGKICITISVITVLTFIFSNSISQQIIVHRYIDLDIFAGIKLVSILIALAAPSPTWLGYLLIAFCLFVPPLQVLWISPEIATFSNHKEPWITMTYSLVSFLILKFRLERHKLETSLIESKANEKSLEEFASATLVLRDISSASLHSLDLLMNLLKNENIDSQQAAQHLQKDLNKLNEVMHIFNEQQKRLIPPKHPQQLE